MIKSKKTIPIILAIVMLIADQLSKLAVIKWLPKPPAKTIIIPYIIDFQYLENPGAAFGWFSEHRWVFMLLTTVAIIIALYILFFKNIKSRLVVYSLALIISGGIGNMIDRVFRTIVIDFINFSFVQFAVFNIADCCVVIGGALLLLYLFVDTLNEFKNKKNGEEIAGN